MNNHLNENQLIEYQFKLASDADAENFAEHLKHCSRCRTELEKLNRKFISLDLLKEKTDVPDTLISKLTKQTANAAVPKVSSLRKPAWVGAAAAVIVLALIFSASLLNKDRTQPQPAKSPSADTKKESLASAPYDTDKPSFYDKADEKSLSPSAKQSSRKTVAANGIMRRELIAEVIDEKPPFAPASAIELVTLPKRQNVQLTIYNSADMTLVREKRNLTLKKGWNWLQFMWANTLIDPTSLNLEPKAGADKVDVQQLVFPPRLRELGRWLIRSEIQGLIPFDVTYFTSGLNWRAFYMGTLSTDERKMELKGYVRIENNSGEDYENAQTRLIVGQVHLLEQIAQLAKRQYPYDSSAHPTIKKELEELYSDFDEDIGKLNFRSAGLAGGIKKPLLGRVFKPKEIEKKGLSEYFLYTIEGTETIPDKWAKRLLCFDVNSIDVNSLYKFDEQRWHEQTIRFISFANDEDHNLGTTPIPNGNVKIYSQTADNRHLAFVGSSDLKYIPVDEDVELNLGPARLVRVEPILMNFKTENYSFDNKGNIEGYDEIRTWKIEITNTRNLPVDIEITRGFGTAYWKLLLVDFDSRGRDPVKHEQHDATHVRFYTKLSPRTKQSFSYIVTTYHGTREQVMTKAEQKD
jgi:hypothetical protein